MKRLPMFLDGTWNSPEDNTNVWRSELLVADTDAGGHAQEAYYHVGVGTKLFDRLLSGALGWGLSANLRDAYQWLMSRYEDGDKIYLFGFSRGAYTARTLAGMIAKCGLLLPGSSFSIPQIFERYRLGKDAQPLYQLTSGRYPRKDWSDEDAALVEQSRRVEIEFIGVWDTVGALGIPFGRIPYLSRRSFYFHNTNPSDLYRHMYQALAIDENRHAYQASLWTKFQEPKGPVPTLEHWQKMEQRWFIGAHCNVGGGYRMDPLAQIPLAWLLEKAGESGLRFKRRLTLTGDEYRTKPRDSYASFIGGLYRVFRRRFFRTIGRDPVATKTGGGVSHSLHETIDASVFERWHAVSDYRPKNVVEWAKRRGLNPDDLHGDQVASSPPDAS